eukprot:scaffold23250_cov31-Tisochrysis_lutea.AAC.5
MRNAPIDLLDSQPEQGVGHQLLEAHVLNSGNLAGPLKVILRGVSADLTLACVVDHELCHLAQRTSFLAVVDDDTRAASLLVANGTEDKGQSGTL